MEIAKQLLKAYAPKAIDNLSRRTIPMQNVIGIEGYAYVHPKFQPAVQCILAKAKDLPKEVKRVILFGSTLTYNIKETSDLDICVIVDKEDHHTDIDLINRIDEVCECDIPEDILIESESEFLARSLKAWSVERKISTKGFEIWRRSLSAS